MAAGLLRRLSEGVLLDEFAVALLKACFEAWVTCTKKCNVETKLRKEIAELRSELVEARRLCALSQARVKQLEVQITTEQEWIFETERFCQRSEVLSKPVHSDENRLQEMMFERDQAMVEREQLRLELTAMQLVSQAREDFASAASTPRSPRLQRAQLAAVTRQLQDCCIGVAPTQTSTTVASSSPRRHLPVAVSHRERPSAAASRRSSPTSAGERLSSPFFSAVQSLAAFEHLRSCTTPPAQSDAVRKLAAVVANRIP